MSEPSGYYGYSYEPDGDMDTFTTCFHAKGIPRVTRTFLPRIPDCLPPVWRGVGDQNKIYEDLRSLTDWHNFMAPLSSMDVVLTASLPIEKGAMGLDMGNILH